MEIKNCKWSEFLENINDKKIICFGTGRYAISICDNHKNFADKIEFFLDNNEKKQGKQIIAGKEYDVFPVEHLLNIDSFSDTVLLITTVYFDEVLEQIKGYKNLDKCVVYAYSLMEIADEVFSSKESRIEKKLLSRAIPKTIHYCWFGRNEKNSKIISCIKSWKEKCPDYEIIEWNEDNFDINISRYAKEAYESKKYAFVSDYVRLYVLYNYGGIYMDTDVEVIKPLDDLLYVEGFTGFETRHFISTGIIAAVKGNMWVKEQLDSYDNNSFFDSNGEQILTVNEERITKISKKKHNLILDGNQQILKYGMVIYPKDYFSPKYAGVCFTNITNNTYTIHHFEGSWLPNETIEKNKRQEEIFKKYSYLLGNE